MSCRLAMDSSANVRRSLAASSAAVSGIIGADKTAKHWLPLVFKLLQVGGVDCSSGVYRMHRRRC